MNWTPRITVTALAALLAMAPVAAFAQAGSSGAGSAGSASEGINGATPSNPGSIGGSTTMNAPASGQTYNGSSSQMGNMSSSGSGQGQQLSQDTVQNVQQQLQQQGYFKNAKVDGRWGPQTSQAVQSYQQAKGLPTTGQLDQQTLSALGVKQGG